MKATFLDPFYRPATKAGEMREDMHVINEAARIALVADGVSEPYNKNVHRKDYGGGMTGGQMVGQELKCAVESATRNTSLRDVLLAANEQVLQRHLSMDMDPAQVAVGGACVAACQIRDNEIVIITIGDAWANYVNALGWNFRTNINEAAYALEARGNMVFDAFKHLNCGNIGDTWVDYYTYMCRQQYFRANRNAEIGGHGMLNCYRDVQDYWSVDIVHPASSPNRIVLGTDGMLPSRLTDPRRHKDLEMMLGCQIATGGAEGVYRWAGSYESEPHIGQGNRPEATMLQLTIKY